MSSQQNEIPQFTQLEPLKMIKRALTKESLSFSSTTSNVDTIVYTKIHEKRLGL